MSTTESRLLISKEDLRRIYDVIHVASVKADPPEHFTETILFDLRLDGDKGEVNQFTATDGYRFHRVEMPADSLDHGQIYVPAMWLGEMLEQLVSHKECAEHPYVEIVSASMQRGEKNLVDYEVTVRSLPERIGPGVQCSTSFIETNSFSLDTIWPEMDKLFSDEEEIYEGDVHFNVRFLTDVFNSANAWWADDGLEDSFPLKVHNFVPSRPNRFSLKSKLGTLLMVLMPTLPQDYDDDDDF